MLTKTIAGNYVWWLGFDKDIKDLVNKCHRFQVTRNEPVKTISERWFSTTKPQSRIHIDFARPFISWQAIFYPY